MTGEISLKVAGKEILRKSNIRVNYSVLALMEAANSGSDFAHRLAWGTGLGTGSLVLPEAPSIEGESLRNELGRVATTKTFLDLAGAEGDTITDGVLSNKLNVSATIPLADSSALLTEFALFGGADAVNPNDGYMIAWVTIPAYDNQTSPEDLTIDWVLKFANSEVEA